MAREFYIIRCPRCGGENVISDDEYCQTCGYDLGPYLRINSINRNNRELVDDAKEEQTICVIVSCQKSGIFAFTQLKKDITPKSLLKNLSSQGTRMMEEPNPYHFYVFKNNKYPYLTEGVQINLNLENYDRIMIQGYSIFFDKSDFSKWDIEELKTYNFS